MVNVGGPSRGCITCIQRKIRCDRQRPVCSQCQKSSRWCRGYRDINDTMFRDQSQLVMDRIQAANSQQSQDGSVTTLSPRLNVETGLISFFANNFLCGGSGSSASSAGTNLFWVPSHFDDLLKVDCAKYSVQSVGAMALARVNRSNEYFRESQRKYGRALLNLVELWQHQVDVNGDTVLVTTLFLSFFEILASYPSSSRRSWTTHLEGLGMLLNKRGKDFLTTGFGSRMLLQSRSQAILNALQTKTPVAAVYQQSNRGFQDPIPSRLIVPQTADVLQIRLANLQAQCQGPIHCQTLVTELKLLDEDCCHWTQSVPASWSFSRQSTEGHAGTWWEGRSDVYSTPVMADVWNKVRTARLIIHDLIWKLSLTTSFPDGGSKTGDRIVDPENEQYLTVEVRGLITDICATIPRYYRPSTALLGSRDSMEDRPLLGTTYWLLWPLDVLGSLREIPVELKEWSVQCLNRIHDTTGIFKAQVIASRLRSIHTET